MKWCCCRRKRPSATCAWKEPGRRSLGCSPRRGERSSRIPTSYSSIRWSSTAPSTWGLSGGGGKPDQPINTGIVLAEPGRPIFWKHYGAIAMNLPVEIHGWWCDQLAYSVLLGAAHRHGDRLLIDDARVLLMDYRRACAKPDHATSETWTVHYKGALKGDGWNEIFIKRQCGGKS
jgi:hypothetical protein